MFPPTPTILTFCFFIGRNKMKNEFTLNDLDKYAERIIFSESLEEAFETMGEAIDRTNSPSVSLLLPDLFVNRVKQFKKDENKKCHTYILYNELTELYKIGKTTVSVESRRKTLSCNSGQELELVFKIDKDIELKLHNRFAESRGKGEWFEIDQYDIINLKNEFY